MSSIKHSCTRMTLPPPSSTCRLTGDVGNWIRDLPHAGHAIPYCIPNSVLLNGAAFAWLDCYRDEPILPTALHVVCFLCSVHRCWQIVRNLAWLQFLLLYFCVIPDNGCRSLEIPRRAVGCLGTYAIREELGSIAGSCSSYRKTEVLCSEIHQVSRPQRILTKIRACTVEYFKFMASFGVF